MMATMLFAATVSASPTTMRAVQISSFGGPDVLRIATVDRPVPGPGELLVRVHAASVNPVDTYTRAGETAGITGAKVPYIPGFDVSGVVESVGEGVVLFGKDDEVMAMLDLRRGGAYAEYAIVKESEAALKPKQWTHAEAASVPLTALTAWQALFDAGELKRRQTVLIHAGAGGVGSMAIQLAKWKGAARIIATASSENHEYLRQLGADEVIDYRTQKFEEIVKDVDVVLDPVGGDTQARSIGVLKEGGRLVSIVGLGDAARRATNIKAQSILVHPDGTLLARIAVIVKPVVTHTFTLEDVKAAHVQSETGRTRGKIVLKVRER
jgi:NADPH:quinone reductase-like Zn-dependent oxidoreductase